MDLTIQLITQNNEKTIEKALDSLQPLKARIIIGDTGSTDRTIALCEDYGAIVLRLPPILDYSEVRNNLCLRYPAEWHMYLQPWEVLSQGHGWINRASHMAYYLPVIEQTIITYEVRLWRGNNYKFVNPVFEYLNCKTDVLGEGIIYSSGRSEYHTHILDKWKERSPTSPEPYYYQACIYLTERRYSDFLHLAEHYMFLDNTASMPAIMNRYYYAMVRMMDLASPVRPILQNINICLCYRPLMAELWCLMGDLYYHRIHKFDMAKIFYDNAIVLGSRRLAADRWPLDISKYQDYPERMIASCNQILSKKSYYI